MWLREAVGKVRSMLRLLSLRLQWSLWVGLLFVIGALLIALCLPTYVEARARRWMLERVQDNALLVARGAGLALAEGDEVRARHQLELLSALPEARFGLLSRADGTPLASWNEALIPRTLPRDVRAVSLEPQQVLVRLEVASRSGTPGTLLVGFGTTRLEQERAALRRQTLGWSGGVLGLGLLVAWALSALMVRPLERMRHVARRLSSRDGLVQDGAGLRAAELSGLLEWMYEQTDLVESLVFEVTGYQERLHVQHQLMQSQVSQLHSMQDQLIVADRRASVGTLSAGVAHEVNNPLAYITANIQFATQELRRLSDEGPGDGPALLPRQDGEEILTALAEAGDGCSRVQHIVLSLKSFSSGDDGKQEPMELARALKTAANMASNEIRHRARLVQDFQPLPLVDANEVRLAQVFLNLLINAAHSIQPGAVEQNEIRIHTGLGGDGRVRVSITDTGGGMTPEVRSRLFTPFFTTKPVGVGTGLGLSVCQGIVQGMGGQIEVQSEPGRGSTFTVILPPSKTLELADPRLASSPLKTRRARILVVDDEPRVGSALRRALSREHEVCVTSGAREALAHVCRGPAFDVILCDLMMPEMTGMEFYAELERTDPAQSAAVLFLTGGALTDVAGAFLADHPQQVLLKPLDMEALRERLRGLLERPAFPPPAPAAERAEGRASAAHARGESSLRRDHAAR